MYSSLLGALWGEKERALPHSLSVSQSYGKGESLLVYYTTFFPFCGKFSITFFCFYKKTNSTFSDSNPNLYCEIFHYANHTSTYYCNRTYPRVSFYPERCKVKLEIRHTDQTLQNNHTEGVKLQAYEPWWNNNWQSYRKYIGWSLLFTLCPKVLIKAITFA